MGVAIGALSRLPWTATAYKPHVYCTRGYNLSVHLGLHYVPYASFSRQCLRRLPSYVMWHRAVLYKRTGILEHTAASVSSIEKLRPSTKMQLGSSETSNRFLNALYARRHNLRTSAPLLLSSVQTPQLVKLRLILSDVIFPKLKLILSAVIFLKLRLILQGVFFS
jgi:hypothetical protein